MPNKSRRKVTPKVNPRFGRRSWIKLWVNEWLDGTTRFEMNDSQRAFWTDLLAMAGRSRFPGIICAGVIQGQYVGYPLNKFQALMSDPIDVEETLRLFERTGKVVLSVTSESPVKLFKVELTGWDKYQSEYQRQKPYRVRAKLQAVLQKGDKTEVEVEVEREVDKKQIKRNIFKQPTREEIHNYCRERANSVDPEQFHSYYQANGWKVGRNSMKDWQAAIRTWEKNSKGGSNGNARESTAEARRRKNAEVIKRFSDEGTGDDL